MDGGLSFDLHALTSKLDRAADRILRSERDISYRRFLALYLVTQLDEPTQRALAEALGVTEPSVSRMTGVLSDAGYLDTGSAESHGNRRRLSLTPDGEKLVTRCRELLEHRFTRLVESSGVPYDHYAEYTRMLLRTLDPQRGEGDR